MEQYDYIGKTYNLTRKADPRITKAIIEYLRLPEGAIVADIGAGTGNYSFELALRGYQVLAVEPAGTMMIQGKRHENLKWFTGKAEKIPFDNCSVDGVICILAIHHFTDIIRSLKEIKRILKKEGSLVVFTFDPRLCPPNFWILDYFPTAASELFNYHPPIEDFKHVTESVFQNTASLFNLNLPYDLEDAFFFSGWRCPENYLTKLFCMGISSLAKLPQETLDSNIENLRQDLTRGLWFAKYGQITELKEYDCGYRFLVVQK